MNATAKKQEPATNLDDSTSIVLDAIDLQVIASCDLGELERRVERANAAKMKKKARPNGKKRRLAWLRRRTA